MHTDEHYRFCVYLYTVLTERLADDPTAVVLGDVRVAWAHTSIRPHGPDIALIFNVNQRQNWSTFSEVEEGTKPSLIIEVTSPGTYSVDLERKIDHYAQVGVAFYVIVDIAIRRDMPAKRLLGYQLTEDGYAPVEPNADGWLWLAPVKLWLGWHGEDIACYDAAGNLMEVGSRRIEEAQARADAEAQARVEAEQRATAAEQRAEAEAQARHQLEAELRRLRGDANNE